MSTFIQELDHLLDERSRLRSLLADRVRLKITAQRDKLADIERDIAALVLDPLDLHKCDIPGTWMVVEAVAGFAWLANDPRYIEQPELAWYYEDGRIVPSIPTAEWNAEVRSRIEQLTASLDGILLRSKEVEAAA